MTDKKLTDEEIIKALECCSTDFKTVEQIKAEAYKEFAERLKNKIIDTPFGINCTIDMVDNLLKEMVGDE